MKYEVKVLTLADNDIDEIFARYNNEQEGLGTEFVLELNEYFILIQSNPKLYPVIEGKVHRALLKRFPYKVFYRTYQDTVYIMRVIHQKRHPDIWKKK